MTLMREIEWESCLLPLLPAPEFERRFERATGRPNVMIGYLAGNDWPADVVIRLSATLEARVELDADLADMVSLVVSQEASCRYCFAATRALLRLLGMAEERIRALEQGLTTADLSERERGALDFARRMARSDPLISPDDTDSLRRLGFTELEVAEISGVVTLSIFFNRVATLCALPPYGMEKLPDRWYPRWFRPLIAWRLRHVRSRTAVDPLRPEERGDAFAPALLGLDGLPVARALQASLAGMWESPTLPRRTKAMVFAVVARALGCRHSEDEATRLLRDEGLTADEIEQILAHLASPVLDPVERVVVPFARETVWYQPVQIQRRARDVLASLSRDPFIETVTAASLANAVCRLGFAWSPPTP